MMPRADISGQRFGKLIAIECAGRRKGNTFWACVCDCGGTITTRLSSLRGGVTRSCKCLCAASLVGETYGRLTVVRRDGYLPKSGALWVCQCQCGNMLTRSTNALRSNNTKSCGCLKVEKCVNNGLNRIISLVGQTFGWLTVDARVIGPASTRSSVWQCTCKCGTAKTVRSTYLRSGSTISCGCAIATAQTRPPLTSISVRAKSAASNHVRRARKAKVGGSFTSAQVGTLYVRQKGLCAEPTCRVALNGKFHRDHKNPLALGGSNDISNIQLLCAPCNIRKRSKAPDIWARENGRLI